MNQFMASCAFHLEVMFLDCCRAAWEQFKGTSMPLEMTMTMPSKMNCSASLSAKPHIAARRQGEESAWQQSLPQTRAKTVSRHVRDLSIIQHVWQKIRSPNPDLEGIRMSALPDHHFKVCLLLAISRSPSIPTICPPLRCNQVTTTILPMYGSHESDRYVAGIVMDYIYSRTHKQTQSMWILTIEYSFECPLTIGFWDAPSVLLISIGRPLAWFFFPQGLGNLVPMEVASVFAIDPVPSPLQLNSNKKWDPSSLSLSCVVQMAKLIPWHPNIVFLPFSTVEAVARWRIHTLNTRGFQYVSTPQTYLIIAIVGIIISNM